MGALSPGATAPRVEGSMTLSWSAATHWLGCENERLLRDEKLAISEVAFLLGYSEPSTFYRAFRRWHGISPRAYRRRESR